MKNSKKLKLVLMILICILVILVGFLGIYSKTSNSYKNILPEYELASDLKGSTVLEFEVDETVETIYYDKDGREVDSSTITEENKDNYVAEERIINEKENLNSENYKKVVSIMKERLEFLQADQYRLDLDEEKGKIVLTFEDDYPDDIRSFLPMEGKLELVDSNTEDIILTYNDFIKAEAKNAYIDDVDNVAYNIYMNLKLNDSGINKVKNIDKYKTSVNSETQETEINDFKVLFDGDEIATVSYDDILLNGKNLRITIAKKLVTNSEINSKFNMAVVVSKFATIGKLPVIYNITAQEYIKSNSLNSINHIIVLIISGIIGCFSVIILKYKFKGLLAILSFVTNIALFLIIIRVIRIQISLNGFAGIVGLIILNIILITNILENIKNKDKNFSENIKKAYLNSMDALVVMAIIFIVFTLTKIAVISFMGQLIFWGWIVTVLGNLIFTVPMLSLVNKK